MVTVWQINNTLVNCDQQISTTVDTKVGTNDISYTDSEFRPKGTRATSVDSDGRDYRRDRIADLHEERRASKRASRRVTLVTYCTPLSPRSCTTVSIRPIRLNFDMSTESPRVNSTRMRTFIGASHPIRLIGKVVNVGLRPSITSLLFPSGLALAHLSLSLSLRSLPMMRRT